MNWIIDQESPALSPLEQTEITPQIRNVQHNLEAAILRTLAYADVFDFPMNTDEIHRYLIGPRVPPEDVQSFLHHGAHRSKIRRPHPKLFTLAGREGIIERRRSRSRASQELWAMAQFFARVIAQLPYVRMIAVTGALAVNNAEPDDDIDYLIVTAPGRLWLCRALVIAVVRLARLRGVTLCPNYFLSTQALDFSHQSLYTAHELTQMVPLSGLDVYEEMRRRNAWTDTYLPNADGPPPETIEATGRNGSLYFAQLSEMVLQHSIGSHLENWEMKRKINKLTPHPDPKSETSFCADWCKGHFDNHGQGTLAAYRARLESISLPIQEPSEE